MPIAPVYIQGETDKDQPTKNIRFKEEKTRIKRIFFFKAPDPTFKIIKREKEIEKKKKKSKAKKHTIKISRPSPNLDSSLDQDIKTQKKDGKIKIKLKSSLE